MGWFGSPEWHLLMVGLWGMMALVWTFGYVRGNKPRSETALHVAMATGWISYSIEEAGTLLSLPSIVTTILSALGLLIFIVLVVVWFRTPTVDGRE